MTEKQLVKLTHYWSTILGLQDWSITVQLLPSYDMPGCYGDSRWVLAEKKALIRIADPKRAPEELSLTQDIEETLVHELIHVVQAALLDHIYDSVSKQDILNDLLIEQPTNQLAKAFTDLVRYADE